MTWTLPSLTKKGPSHMGQKAPEFDTDLIRRKADEAVDQAIENLENKRRKSFDWRTWTIGLSTLAACITGVLFIANARPILADILTTPDVIARHTSEIRELHLSLSELTELKRDFNNLNGQVNQLRGILDGQLSVARQLEDSILRLQLMTEEHNRINKIHLDNLREAIREARQR